MVKENEIQKSEMALVDSIPKGFEIYENPYARLDITRLSVNRQQQSTVTIIG